MNSPAGYKKVLKEFAFDLLRAGNSVRIMASGYSMYPSIKPGDIILIDPLPYQGSLITGDIIAWQRDSDFVVHRLVHITDSDNHRYYLTRGDSSLSSDEPVSAGQLTGIVTTIERDGRLLPVKPVSFIPEWRYWLNRQQVWLIVRLNRVLSILNICK